MFNHLLIATDGSELAEKAVAQGLALAKSLTARVTIVTVTDAAAAMAPGDLGFAVGIAFPHDEYKRSAAAGAKSILAKARNAAVTLGVPSDEVHVAEKLPAEGIIETATARGCDLIVMASHGRRGLSRLLLGSQTLKVATLSPIPVLVIR